MADDNGEQTRCRSAEDQGQSIDSSSRIERPSSTTGGKGDTSRHAGQYGGSAKEAERQVERLLSGMFARGGTLYSAVQDSQRSLLDKLKHRPSPADTTQIPIIELELEGEIWTLRGLGTVVRFRDSRGMRMLAQLMARPGQELHALDLSCTPRGAVDGGDAGPELDRKAIDAYRIRLRELQREVAEAESWNDAGRLARAQRELEFLEAEVKRAVGLGGRERRVGGAVERARINVQRRIAAVLRKMQAASPTLGRHFANSVHTGTFCSYQP